MAICEMSDVGLMSVGGARRIKRSKRSRGCRQGGWRAWFLSRLRGTGTGQADAAGEAVGVLQAELEGECAVDEFRALHGKLRDDAVFVFDFDGQVVMWEHIVRAIEDGGEFAGEQAVTTGPVTAPPAVG